jgi:hypothetical protein
MSHLDECRMYRLRSERRRTVYEEMGKRNRREKESCRRDERTGTMKEFEMR